MEEAREVSIDYTCKAIDVMLPETKNLRFVYISGFMTERDQEKPLWIMGDYRRIRVSPTPLPAPLSFHPIIC